MIYYSCIGDDIMELQEKKALGLQMYLKGVSLTKISEHLNVNRITLTKYIKSNGVEVTNSSKKFKYNEDFFEAIDSEETAYWLGFLYADGCINQRLNQNGVLKSMTLEVTLKLSDCNHLFKLADALEFPREEIAVKESKLNNKIFRSARITICSTKMCKDLIKYGCTPRKSLVLEFPEWLPRHLCRHFIRGYLDGEDPIANPLAVEEESIS